MLTNALRLYCKHVENLYRIKFYHIYDNIKKLYHIAFYHILKKDNWPKQAPPRFGQNRPPPTIFAKKHLSGIFKAFGTPPQIFFSNVFTVFDGGVCRGVCQARRKLDFSVKKVGVPLTQKSKNWGLPLTLIKISRRPPLAAAEAGRGAVAPNTHPHQIL